MTGGTIGGQEGGWGGGKRGGKGGEGGLGGGRDGGGDGGMRGGRSGYGGASGDAGGACEHTTDTSSTAMSDAHPRPRMPWNKKLEDESSALASCQSTPWAPTRLQTIRLSAAMTWRVPIRAPFMW